MGFNIKLEDYKDWAKNERSKGNNPDLKSYIETIIKKTSSQEANQVRWDKTTMIKI